MLVSSSNFIIDLVNSYHIFELRSLIATSEKLKSVEYPMHALTSSKFEFKIFLFKMRCSFKLHCSYNVVQVTFRVLHEKTLQSKKQQTKIHFSHCYKLVKMGNFF